MRTALRTLCLGLVLFVGACASGGTGSSGGGGRRDALTADELTASGASNVYDAIRSLRSEWLNPRSGSIGGVQGQLMVYLDNARFGGPETLRNFRPEQIASVRYVNPTDAQARYGSDHVLGAILLTTKR